MNGFLRKTLNALCLGSGAAAILGSVGCAAYRDVVDPCWPERYNIEARQVVNQTFDTQAHNGHVLDQTFWAYDFERDEKNQPTDRLNALGMDKVRYIVRRRPVPDGKIYLQAANDVYVPQAEIETLPVKRQELDAKRIQTIQRILTAEMVGRVPPITWDICVHDATEVGLPSSVAGGATGAVTVVGSYPKWQGSFLGALTGSTGSTGAATGGPTNGPSTAAGPSQLGAGQGTGTPPAGN
jgi:hypothetical protein